MSRMDICDLCINHHTPLRKQAKGVYDNPVHYCSISESLGCLEGIYRKVAIDQDFNYECIYKLPPKDKKS